MNKLFLQILLVIAAITMLAIVVTNFISSRSKDIKDEVLDAQRYCIQQAIWETGTDPSKWSSSKYVYAVVILSDNSLKVQIQKPDGDAYGKLFPVYKTTDNDFIFENGEKLFDGRDLRSIEDAVKTTLNKPSF